MTHLNVPGIPKVVCTTRHAPISERLRTAHGTFALPSMIVPDLSIRLRGAFRRSTTAIIALRSPGSSAEKGWCPLSLPAPPIGSVAPLSNDSDVQRAGMGAPMLLCRKVTGAPAAALALGARERPLDHLSPVTITEWLRRATVDATGSAAWRTSRPSSMLRLASAGSPPIAGRAHPQSRNSRARGPALSRTMKQALLCSSIVQGGGKRRGGTVAGW